MADLQALANSVIKGNRAEAIRLTREAMDTGIPHEKILKNGLIAGIEVVGTRFKCDEVCIKKVVAAARVLNMAVEILEPEMTSASVNLIGKDQIQTQSTEMITDENPDIAEAISFIKKMQANLCRSAM